MGERLGTDRTNIWRIRKLMMDKMYIPIEQHPTERGKWYIHPEYSITHIAFSREQMAALYLAGRRLQQQTRTSQQHVADMLQKVAHALRKPLAESLVQAADHVLAQEQDEQQKQVFATIVRCWLDQIPVRIVHRKLHGEPRNYVVHPWQIEPAVWGDGNYLLGYSEYHGKLATFKLARIEKATESVGRFRAAPGDFNIHDLLNFAWGIWHADEEPVTVQLRFNKWAVPRLRESIWHPQARLFPPDEEGSCVWEVRVAEWREMESWVKGWGSNVEVIEPIELRERLVAEVGRLARTYATETPPPAHRLLWAKTDAAGHTHPLFCHLIDVGQVALALWNDVLTSGFQAQIAEALGTDPASAGRLFAFWSGTHDIGKASPNFQRKFGPAQSQLQRIGFTFPPVFGKNQCYHATISALILPALLTAETDLDADQAREVAQALGGHHGSWPTAVVRRQHEAQIGDERWQEAQRTLLRELVDLFNPPTIRQLGRDDTERGAILVLLSGLASVADWMGSMSDYFQFSTAHVAPELYVQIAARRAERVLKKLGWTDWQPTATELSFEALHGFGPRPAQQAVIDLAPGEREPTLIIAEVPTGAGKTELALYLADRWAVTRRQQGLYVAMPTQATSNQMWERVGKFLRRRYPQEKINFHLIHGNAQWRDDLPDLEFTTGDESAQGNVEAQSWFLPRKRTLLAPFAVGTVDQALLSTLQTRHFFVRLFGLSRKTVIFDEVHAYDTYMSSLFQRLLVWLRAVGSSVIVLSATLPASTRRELVAAWRGRTDGLDTLSGCYPAVTVAAASELYSQSLPVDDTRTINLEWIGHNPEAIVAELRPRLQNGGCVAIICNRVRRAQEIYSVLQAAQLVPDDDLILFHARTPGIWRNATEKDVLDRFGKEAQERRPAIVVATQVIEQSLDLDFDLMVSDLAPVDLILQRAGRLHRHERDTRPLGLERPTLLITTPANKNDGAPDWSGDEYVYEPYVLFRSLLTLRAADEQLVLPVQTVDLIESVYGEEAKMPDLPSEWTDGFNKARQSMAARQRKAEMEAYNRLVALPAYEELLWLPNDLLAEEEADVHQSLQALTRLIEPSVRLVCLHQEADGLALDPGGPPAVDLKTKPSHEQTKELAQRVVTVTHRAIYNYFTRQNTPSGWREHTLLHTHRAAIFVDGECRLEGTDYVLRLSRRLGLEIVKIGSSASPDAED
ncbi:MAG: hypothetical protein DCC55_18525 [Chloroflexi bacterium]|nr:MAG: hypothetical protein DCC55_18525 [Chloroflexota bacterium]